MELKVATAIYLRRPIYLVSWISFGAAAKDISNTKY